MLRSHVWDVHLLSLFLIELMLHRSFGSEKFYEAKEGNLEPSIFLKIGFDAAWV